MSPSKQSGRQFKLPDLGEGLQDAEIVEWMVEVGQQVKVDELMLVVETAKAVVELPSPFDGVISKRCADPGDTVHVGETLVMYEGVGEEESSVSVVGELKTSAASKQTESQLECFSVGGAGSHDADNLVLAKEPHKRDGLIAPPDVLAFARQLGLESALESKSYGSVTKKDLARLFESRQQKNAGNQVVDPAAQGINKVIRLNAAKKVMAQTMAKSHQQVPAVSLFDDAVIDAWYEKGKAKSDMTVRLIQAIVKAVERVPIMNAWFDEENLSIQTFNDINIGIAVNSNDGLFVPVIRHAQTIKPEKIRSCLDKLVAEVDSRTIKPQKLLGATISLSNFGTLSGRYATPIVVPPQVAILGVGKARQQAIVKEGQVVAGLVLPVSLSFDHRAATGAEAAMFLQTLIAEIEK